MRTDFGALSRRGQLRRLAGLAGAALAEYGLAGAPIRPLGHLFNTTFDVRTPAGRCVLRVNRPGTKTPAQVRSEMQWLAALRRDSDLGVPEPVPTRAGDLLAIAAAPGVPEPRSCALFRWVSGRFLDRGLRPAHLERVGAFTAHLHAHAAAFAPPPGFTREPVGALSEEHGARAVRVVGERVGADDAAVVAAAVAEARSTLAEVARLPGAVGLIHADLHQWNYLFAGDEVRAIDFDDCGVGPLVYDLAVTVSELGRLPRSAELRAALLRGYRRVRPLPFADERQLDAAVALRHLQSIGGLLEWEDDPALRDHAPHALAGLPTLRHFVGASGGRAARTAVASG